MEYQFKQPSMDLPIYKDVRDVTFIGVGHRGDPKKEPEKVGRFVNEVVSGPHLIMEGKHKILLSQLDRGHFGYETMAYVAHDRDYPKTLPIFLEENSDRVTIAENYGFSNEMFSIYAILGFIPQLARDEKATPDNIISSFENIKNASPGLQTLNTESVLRKCAGVILSKKVPGSELSLAGSISKFYLGRIADYEIMDPGLQELVETLTGKKIVVVGGGHVEYLASSLEGVQLSKPPDWEDFVDNLESEHRTIIRNIESLI